MVSDHQHVGLKLHGEETGTFGSRGMDVFTVKTGRAETGESNSPGVTQDCIHAGKIDGTVKNEGCDDEAFHRHQTISARAG